MWCLLAPQNNKTHTEEVGEKGEEVEWVGEEKGEEGEGVKKLLLLIKNEELVHIDRT